jgi:hypothetical protein
VVPISSSRLGASTDALYLSVFAENLAERRVAEAHRRLRRSSRPTPLPLEAIKDDVHVPEVASSSCTPLWPLHLPEVAGASPTSTSWPQSSPATRRNPS